MPRPIKKTRTCSRCKAINKVEEVHFMNTKNYILCQPCFEVVSSSSRFGRKLTRMNTEGDLEEEETGANFIKFLEESTPKDRHVGFSCSNPSSGTFRCAE